VYEIGLAEIKEPILCCPNAPDDARPLSPVAGARRDEVCGGSCMTKHGLLSGAGRRRRAGSGLTRLGGFAAEAAPTLVGG